MSITTDINFFFLKQRKSVIMTPPELKKHENREFNILNQDGVKCLKNYVLLFPGYLPSY